MWILILVLTLTIAGAVGHRQCQNCDLRLLSWRAARYITRAPLKIDALRKAARSVAVRPPYDPRSGQHDLELDPLEFVHRLC